MKCPHCDKEIDHTVCPLCHEEVKRRSGLTIPVDNTLYETVYAIGQKYARYYRIACLKPEGHKPLKLSFGCEEKPLGFLTGARAWFNPVILTPEHLELLWQININQMCASWAYETRIRESTLVASQVMHVIDRLVRPSNLKGLVEKTTRYLKMME